MTLYNNFLLKRGVGLFSGVGLISGDYGTRYPTVCLICARIRSRISATIYIENQESKKAAARAIYNASPEMKRAAYHASYRADPKEKRVASRVASRASCLPPRVPLFKAYLY